MKITKNHIINWLEKHYEVKITSGGKQARICNPFDNDDDFHFWIGLEETVNKFKTKGYWAHDFRPGRWSGNFVNFVRKVKNLSRFEAIREITNCNKNDLKNLLRNEQKIVVEEIQKELELPPQSFEMSNDTHFKIRDMCLKYLAGRCVNKEKANALNLYYTIFSCIVFPYVEYGSIVYWQEREILNKRFNFPNEHKTGLGKTDFLYNFDNVEPGDFVGIVESIFNCISIGDNCVASGGASISGRQVLKLKALGPKVVVLAPDNDDAGMKSLKSNYFLLKNDFKLAYCLPPDGVKDWNDFEVANGVGSARKYFENNVFNLNLPSVLKLAIKYESGN